jgi:protein AroM
MIHKVGLIALGHASVSDGIPGVSAGLPEHVEVIGCGALDGLNDTEIAALAPREGDHLIVLKAEPGVEAPVAYHHILPRVQDRVHWLESQGAELIAVLCGADWSDLTSGRLLINPGAILPQLAVAMSRGRKLGVILPSKYQVATSERR